LKILRNYIIKETLGPLLGTLGVFTFVLLIGNMLQLADLLLNKGADIRDIIKLFFYLIPYILSYTIPMAILTATVLCFGRLASDSEITAMKASGISLYKIGLPILIIAFMISLGSVYLNDKVLPASHFASIKLVKGAALKNPSAYLEPGTFIKSFKGYIVRINSVDGNTLKGVLIYQLGEKGPTRTIIAKSGNFITHPNGNTITLKLTDGTADEPKPDDPSTFYKLSFKTYSMTLDLEKSLSKGKFRKKFKDMNIRELKDEIASLKATGIISDHVKKETREMLTEIHRKIAMAFSSFVFVLVALPLAINTKKREKSIGFAISLMILLVYYLLLFGGMALALRNILPPIVGVWIANIIYLFVGAILTFTVIEQ